MTPFKLTTVTAFIAIDPTDGDEGVMGFFDTGSGTNTPLICGDEDRIKSMYPLAKHISNMSGMPFRIVQFSVRTDVTDEITKKYDNIKT